MSIIVTASGKFVDLANPDPATICIEDIANHLSKVNRFTGATEIAYSVASHSVYVSHLVEPKDALVALMHDAPEAYLGDVTSPLKSLLKEYKFLEKRMWECIATKFCLPYAMPEAVHTADVQAYVKERVSLIDHPISSDPDYDRFVDVYVPSQPLLIKSAFDSQRDFLSRWEELNKCYPS